jgi:hypothetical protein
MRAVVVLLLLALTSPALNLLLAAEPPKRTLIRSVPAGNIYSYENAAGETVEEMENRQGKLISRRFYRPALPACAYLHSVGLGTGRYWRDDDERVFHCLSPMTQLGTATELYGHALRELGVQSAKLGGEGLNLLARPRRRRLFEQFGEATLEQANALLQGVERLDQTQRRHAAERAQRLLEALDGLGCLLGGAVGLFIVQVDRYAYPSLEIAPRYL